MKNNIISIDAMGNESGPEEYVKGIIYSAKKNPSLYFLIHGNKDILLPLLQKYQLDKTKYELIHKDQEVKMGMKVRDLLKQGKDSSMWAAIEAVRDKKASACVSFANTGALMVASRKILGMIEGVERTALTSFWPSIKGPVVFLDVGSNVDYSPDHLVQFAIMGNAIYKSVVNKNNNPKCAILNIGEEESKGKKELAVAANILRNEVKNINFVGFCEGYDISLGTCQIVVTDGFSGNIALKTGEGTAKLVAETLKQCLTSSLKSKIMAFLLKKELHDFKDRLSPKNHNGAIFAGLNGNIVKGHGASDSLGISGAINIARKLNDFDVTNAIRKDIINMKA